MQKGIARNFVQQFKNLGMAAKANPQALPGQASLASEETQTEPQAASSFCNSTGKAGSESAVTRSNRRSQSLQCQFSPTVTGSVRVTVIVVRYNRDRESKSLPPGPVTVTQSSESPVQWLGPSPAPGTMTDSKVSYFALGKN